MKTFFLFLAPMVLALQACMTVTATPDTQRAHEQVIATERAFAATMARRDLAGFAAFLSDEAIFVSGNSAARGRTAVLDQWRKSFEGPAAPFSWEPGQVEVLASGALALSSGPVFDAKGKVVGRFSSIWRLEAPGTWRIIFDSGCEVCDCQHP